MTDFTPCTCCLKKQLYCTSLSYCYRVCTWYSIQLKTGYHNVFLGGVYETAVVRPYMARRNRMVSWGAQSGITEAELLSREKAEDAF